MYDYDAHIKNLVNEIDAELGIYYAVKEIKNNPSKYPEFDFFKPGYDAEGWAKKAVQDFNEMSDVEMKKMPVKFKLIVMRHYRKLGQTYRKTDRKELVGTLQHWEDVFWVTKKLHPELFQA